MVKLIMSTPMADKIIGFFDGYKDDKISCKFIEKKGIKSYFECETEMSPEEAANYCKSLFKKSTWWCGTVFLNSARRILWLRKRASALFFFVYYAMYLCYNATCMKKKGGVDFGKIERT